MFPRPVQSDYTLGMLNLDSCRQRQERLLKQCGSADAIVITQAHHVYYLTNYRASWRHTPAVVLQKGRATLWCANQPGKDVAADDVRAYPANLTSTLRNDQAQALSPLILDAIGKSGTIAFDSSATASVMQTLYDATFQCIDPILWQLRRAKDADELALMQMAIDASGAMYERAWEIIQPGVSEIDVYNELQAAAVRTTGEPMTSLLGNDFACGTGGGSPRKNRTAQSGELYILDLGPTYRGYNADTSRVFCVNRQPTDAQRTAHAFVMGVFPIVEAMAKPGVTCRAIYNAVVKYYLDQTGEPLSHHLGHGVGLEAHEFPHLNPNWDDTLIEGEIFTCEPGIYTPNLGGGLRIENQYLVTRDGVKNLTPFPTNIA